MLDKPKESRIPEDTITVLIKVLQRASQPLTMKEIQRELPGPFRIASKDLAGILDQQVGLGHIYKWHPKTKRSQERFWFHGLEEFSTNKVLEILSSQALTRSQLSKALKKVLFGGCSKKAADDLRKTILAKLLRERRLFEQPYPGKGNRPSRFFLKPPDPGGYLGGVKKEFEAVCEKLSKVGVPPERVFRAASRILMLAAGQEESGITGGPPIQEAEQPKDIHKLILDKIVEIEPAAKQQALVSIRELRAALGLPKESFNQAILALAAQGKLFLHRHVFPREMTDAERESMVKDGQGSYYMGLVLREPE